MRFALNQPMVSASTPKDAIFPVVFHLFFDNTDRLSVTSASQSLPAGRVAGLQQLSPGLDRFRAGAR